MRATPQPPTPSRPADTAVDPNDGFERRPTAWRPPVAVQAPRVGAPRADLADATQRLRLAVHFGRRL